LGHTIIFNKTIGGVDSDEGNEVDVYCFSKHSDRSDPINARKCRELGKPVVFDICDHHLDDHLADHYLEMCRLATTITCNSQVMVRMIQEKLGLSAVMIPDVWEYPEFPAGGLSMGGCQIKLVWYGFCDNLEVLLEFHRRVGYQYQIDVIVNEADQIHQILSDRRDGVELTNLRIHQWRMDGEEEFFELVRKADLVVIPQVVNPKTNAKSPNRIMTALRLGRFVVATPLEGNEEFSRFCWMGEDIDQGIRWASEHPVEALECVRRGQDWIRDRYSPETVARIWEGVFQE